MTAVLPAAILFGSSSAALTVTARQFRKPARPTHGTGDNDVHPAARSGHSIRRRAVRAEQLDTQLAPALQLVIGHLRIGRNFMSAVSDVAPTVAEPLRGILREVVTETRLGTPADEVLQRIADREDERHLSIVASALGLQARLGGSLVEILETVVDTIEEEDRLRRDIRSLTADGRLSAQILLAMPPVMLVIVSLISPDYAEPLLTDPLGRAMSAMAVVLGVVGWRWLRSLSRPTVRA